MMFFIIRWNITLNFLTARGLSKSWNLFLHLMRFQFFLFGRWKCEWWQRCLPSAIFVHFLNVWYVLIPFALLATLCVLCQLACSRWDMRWCHASRFIPFNNIFLILLFDFGRARHSFSQGPLTWYSLCWHRMNSPLWWATVSIKTLACDYISRLIDPLWQGTLFGLLILPSLPSLFIWSMCMWNWMSWRLDID